MKRFYLKHKQIINELIAFTLIVISILVFLNLNKVTIGRLDSDFATQHIRLIDYLRNNFWATHDFFQQINFNLGGSQNMVSLYYYGLYNPLIMLSYLFPFISTLYWMQIIFLIIVVLTFWAMNLLLRSFDIKKEYVLIVSVLTAFSPPLMFHFSYHPMFIYYFPILIFSLYSINKLIIDNIKWPFIISVSLIFFTNFFFVLAIGFVQLVFLISSIHFRYNLNRQEIIRKYKDFFISLIIGTLIGMVVFLPQVLAIFSGDRISDSSIYIPFFHDNFDYILVSNIYSMGLGVIGITTLIIGIINYRKKFTFSLSLLVLLSMVSSHFIYLLNAFQYVHHKVFIFFVPIIFLLLALELNDKEIKYKKIALLLGFILSIIITRTSANSYMLSERMFLALLFVQFALLFLLYSKTTIYRKTYIVIFLIINSALLINLSTSFISKKDYNKELIMKSEKHWSKTNESEFDFYYTNDEVNFASSLTTFNPLQYTSIVNSEYIDFYSNFVNVERTYWQRSISRTAISNSLISNFLGVKYYINKDRSIKYYENARPFVYGVSENEVYNINSLDNYNITKRLLALNDSLFSKDSNKKYIIKNIPLQQIYSSKKNIVFEKSQDVVVDVSNNSHKKGIYIIETNVISNNIEKTTVRVKGHISTVKPFNSFYKEKEQRNITIFIDSENNQEKLKIGFEGSANIYDQLKVSFIPQSYIDNFKVNYTKTTDNKMIDNKALTFKMNMEEDGYLATSFFFDKGFKIIDNGKEIKSEKVNNNFLGAKLSKGNHDIQIKYEMPGFRIGLMVSVFGLFILAFYMINEIKIFNRSFFRFVLVGAFNTINYFIVYSLLIIALPYMFAHITSFIYSAFVSYFLTSHYTFKTKPSWQTFVAFPLTFLPNLIFSGIGTAFLVEMNIVDKSIASLLVMILIIPITFFISKIIFKKRKYT